MSQNPTNRESLLIINGGSSNQLGPANRTSGDGPGGNYFLRLDWSTVDRFRGVQGAYVATGPAYLPGGASPLNIAAESPNAPLHVTLADTPSITFTTASQRQEMVNYLLEPNNVSWNEANIGGTEDLLQKWVQDENVNEGDPYYSYFLEDGMPTSTTPVPGVFNRPGIPGTFSDHTFAYLKPSENIDQRMSGGLEINIESVYNFYLDTMPAYEQVTSNVPEPVLPNFYIFETELRNTGSQTYSPDYRKALTMFSQGAGHRIADWFVDNDAGGYTETTSKSYYQAYASSLQATKNSESEYNALKVQYNTLLKNVAVLHSDIDAIYRTNRPANKDTNNAFGGPGTSALSFLPFYNIVTVGNDQYRATESSENSIDPAQAENSFFGSLFDVNGFDAESFIDILQMYIITFLEKGTALTLALFHAFEREANPTQTLLTSSLYFDLSDRNAGAGGLPGVPPAYDGFMNYARFLEDRITNNDSNDIGFSNDVPNVLTPGNQYWERDNVVLIRDYSNKPGWETLPGPVSVYNPPSSAAVKDFYERIENGKIEIPMRNFDNVLMNKGAFSETVLYKIDKRVVDTAGNILPNIVQTIYLSPKFNSSDPAPAPLQYIDSQVRYGVRYQYDIKQIRVVFGNQYYYDDLQFYFAGYAGYGGAVGNALGFYQPTAGDILADSYGTYTPPGEDIPVPPGSEQFGYFVVAPTNEDNIDEVQWSYMAEGSDYGDSAKLNRVEIVFKKGWGLNGNASGGALSGEYSPPNQGSTNATTTDSGNNDTSPRARGTDPQTQLSRDALPTTAQQAAAGSGGPGTSRAAGLTFELFGPSTPPPGALGSGFGQGTFGGNLPGGNLPMPARGGFGGGFDGDLSFSGLDLDFDMGFGVGGGFGSNPGY